MQEKVGLSLKIAFSIELFFSVHGQVLAQWPKMFQILSQICKSGLFTGATTLNLEAVSARDSFQAESSGKVSLPTEEGQRLVRIPIDELQQANADKE